VSGSWLLRELRSWKIRINFSRTSILLVLYSVIVINGLEQLEGLRVGHDFEDIEEGEGVILTIKDKGVLDDDGIHVLVSLLTCG
jgi:hypothetical protein